MPGFIVVVFCFIEVFQHTHVAAHNADVGLLLQPVGEALYLPHELGVGNAVVVAAVDRVDQRLVVTDLFRQGGNNPVKIRVLVDEVKAVKVHLVEG